MPNGAVGQRSIAGSLAIVTAVLAGYIVTVIIYIQVTPKM